MEPNQQICGIHGAVVLSRCLEDEGRTGSWFIWAAFHMDFKDYLCLITGSLLCTILLHIDASSKQHTSRTEYQ